MTKPVGSTGKNNLMTKQKSPMRSFQDYSHSKFKLKER